jgi:hypothetical protein
MRIQVPIPRATRRNKYEQYNAHLKAYPAVFFAHMFVYIFSVGKGLHTHPTYMGLTSNTDHVVTPIAFLDGCTATWTVFDVVSFGPLLEKSFPAVLAVGTFLAVMIFDVATRADASQARRAL